jgi:hypothetical protein
LTQSEAIWVSDLGTGKNLIFLSIDPLISKVFFLLHTQSAIKNQKIEDRPKLKAYGGYFWAHMYATLSFLKIYSV